MKALQVGVKHALLAQNALDIFGFYPNKKQKLMPPIQRGYARSTSRSKITKRANKKNTSSVRKTILGMAATYHDTQNDNTVTVAATHNTIYTSNVTAKVVTGTNDTDRQGDQIYMMGLKVKGVVQTATASNGYQYRIIVGYSGEEYNATGFGTGATGLAAAEVFLPSTGSNFATNQIINPKTFTVLYDQTIDLNSQLTSVSDMYGVDFFIPMKTKFPYQAQGSIYGKYKNLYIVVVSSVSAGGVPGTTLSGSISLSTALQFKNL